MICFGTAKNAGNMYKTAYEEESNMSGVTINGKQYGSIEEYMEEINPTIVEGDPKDWDYTVESDETITITGYLNEDKSINKVVIPNYINGAKVKRVRGKSGSYSIWNNAICEGKIQLAASAYRPQNLSIKEIIISSGIEKIENTAFLATSNLEKISIPNSVTTLEGWSFGFCYNLKEITISESVTTMGDHVFYKIPSITIHVPWKEGEKPEGWADDWNSTGSNCTITVDYAK